MTHLLIVAHGSRRQASNDEIHQLAEKVSENINRHQSTNDTHKDITGVSVAFLEMAEPSIPQQINTLFNSGENHISLLPYFLAAGNHVIRDIPEEINQLRQKWPDKDITLLPHIGASDVLIGAICQLTLTESHLT